MTKEQERQYQDTDTLREILLNALEGMKFKLDCGHYVENIIMRREAS